MPPRRETTPFTTPPTPDMSSPRALLSGVQNFAIHSQDVETIRTSLRLELAANIVEDHKAVSDRLGLASVPTHLVDACYDQLLIDEEKNIVKLQNVVYQAERKDLLVKDNSFETHMYKPLVRIIEYIASFGGSKPKRRWIHSETHITGNEMPYSKPDLRLGDPSGELKIWRDLAAFGEVKPQAAQGMAPGQAIKASNALVQSGDYARLHLAGSPFRLFSIGLMITGNNFQVGIFDRAGVMVSSALNMWSNTKTFIRVIRKLTCDLYPMEMGCDPSVFELPSFAEWYPRIREKAKSLGVPRDSLNYPSFIVNCRKRKTILDRLDTRSPLDRDREDWETKEWLTIGPPIWVSLSLLGRGTSIWRVMPFNQDEFDPSARVYILKNTWRNSRRSSESEIYETVEGDTTGVANFHYGGDAVFPYSTSPAISVTNIRNSAYRTSKNDLLDVPCHRSIPATPMLHRLILKTVGRPLWDAIDYTELLKGLRAALIGHEKLCQQGILHRDISAGNILLAVGVAEEGKEGFITDLEFARLRQIRQSRSMANDDGSKVTATTWTDAGRGLLMTGTVQFMAIEKLKAVQSTTFGAPGVADQVYHDLESFIWVFAYTVARRLMAEKRLDSASTKHISKWFKLCFCSLSISDIVLNRAALKPLELPCPIGDDILPKPIQDFLDVLFERVRYNQTAKYMNLVEDGEDLHLFVRRLDHQLLIKSIDIALAKLSRPRGP